MVTVEDRFEKWYEEELLPRIRGRSICIQDLKGLCKEACDVGAYAQVYIMFKEQDES